MAQPNGKHGQVEVQPRARRRTFTAAYKRWILAEADAGPRGQVGTLRRRAGLYDWHLAKWRGEREHWLTTRVVGTLTRIGHSLSGWHGRMRR